MISLVLDVNVFDEEAVRSADMVGGNDRGCDDDETKFVAFGIWLAVRFDVGNGEVFELE